MDENRLKQIIDQIQSGDGCTIFFDTDPGVPIRVEHCRRSFEVVNGRAELKTVEVVNQECDSSV